jgi:hypothetical protein
MAIRFQADADLNRLVVDDVVAFDTRAAAEPLGRPSRTCLDATSARSGQRHGDEDEACGKQSRNPRGAFEAANER